MLQKDTDILEEMLNASETTHKEPNILASLLGFFGATIVGGILLAALVLPLAIPIGAAPALAQDYWKSLPKELPEISLPQRSYIYDANDKRIATFYSENRIEVDLEDISQHTIDALIATEDSRFFNHAGVDWKGVARAFRNNTMSGENEGASTITQQLVKNTLMLAAESEEEANAAKENSYKRKVDEISYAIALEKSLSKEEILERYFNTVLFSNGVYGIGTASQYYFGVPPKDLNVEQSATLIGLLKSPTRYNPITQPENSINRRNTVIERMRVTGVITDEEAQKASSTELELNITKTPNGCSESKYPFYCQWVVDNLIQDERLGKTEQDRASRIHLGGLHITTPLDTEKQKDLQDNVDSMFGRDNRVAIGVAMVEPGTGNVLAMAQNRDWGEGVNKKNGNIRTQIVLPATVAYQSGSSFKPVTLATALESGFPPNASLNAPTSFNPSDMNVPNGGIKNLSSEASGRLSIDKATAISSNTWFAQLQYQVGVLTVADMARNLGITVPDNVTSKDASFTLGTTDTSPLEMSAAYAAFSADGLYCSPRGVTNIASDLDELFEATANCRQAISEATAKRVTKAMKSAIDGNEENRTGKLASIGRDAAGKSGTTNSHSAAWFVGYTPEISTAVWIGDPRGGFKYPLSSGVRFNGSYITNVYASKIAAPAWKAIMQDAVAGTPKQKFDLSSNPSSTSSTVVPDVRGLTLENAIGTLQSQGFKVEVSPDTIEPPEGFKANQVVEQSPPSGRKVFNVKDTVITLTVTDGTEIPDIVR